MSFGSKLIGIQYVLGSVFIDEHGRFSLWLFLLDLTMINGVLLCYAGVKVENVVQTLE